MLDFRTTFAGWLTTVAERLTRSPKEQNEGTRFVDLAPTDKADSAGVYSGALTEATNNPRVMNIALTGPYGSGKSSIIKSFLKRYTRPALQISLAAFLPEAVPAGERVSRQEIERSILQQMLYGANAHRLPLSRFKRIQAPGRWSILASLFISFGLIACWHLVQKHDAIIKGTYFFPFDLTNWFNLLSFAVGCVFLWLIVHNIYIASFGISLKSISLKDIEITPKAATEESILNRHLDEIIYFFQSTNYDLVIFEDLDRFNNADIFVTLREINSLINANSGVTRPVRFLYALRDDMFLNTDRTKFFEFIIPVIPIINSSNSIDKMIEQGKRISIHGRLNSQFLKEVSRYISDLRLIQNIFNEYAIYNLNLETDGETNLDANKLLSVLIYKNVFPSDFENLHRGKGDLAEILRSHDRCIATSEARCTAEIHRLEELIAQSEKQLPNDLAELRKIYAMTLIECIPESYSYVGTDHNNLIPMSQLAKHDQIEQFLTSTQLVVRGNNTGQTRLPKSSFPAIFNSADIYRQRKSDIEKKSTSFRDETLKAIRELRSKMATLRMMKFNEVIRENSDEVDALFDRFGEGVELARFLVLEGYLDDTYYQYTSLFHSGRLSPSDNKFLIRIRGFNNPEPDFQIDNPKEVIAAMRDEDFSRNYALNVKIVDGLLSSPTVYAAQIRNLYKFISANFKHCEAFFSAYYTRGTAVSVLISGLTKAWPDFAQAAIASPGNLSHMARLLSHLPSAQLKELAGKDPAISAFVSSALPDILALGIDFHPDRLQLLGIEASDLSAIGAHSGIIRALFDGGLYKLSIDNLNFIFRAVLDIEADARPNEQNYTLALEAGSAPLLAKIENHFGKYLEDVLLRPDNRSESASTIQRVMSRDDVDFASVVDFLKNQTALQPNLDQVPENFHATIFEIGKIEPSWANCLSFRDSESFDGGILTEFLNRETVVAALGQNTVPDGADALPLRSFIIENNELDDKAYATYVRALPKNFNLFPKGLGSGKTKILVDLERINFSPANLAFLCDDVSLSVKFVKHNIQKFFEVESECELNDEFREELLEAEITDEDRLRLLGSMDLGLFASSPPRAAIVGKILARTGVAVENLGVDAARAVIVNSRPRDTQISLFNMVHRKFDDHQVRELLQSLPDPLPDIKPGFSIPRMKSNQVNLEFVKWLKARGFISSWSQGSFFDDDIRMNMFRNRK